MSRKQRPCPVTGKGRYPTPFAAEVELWKIAAKRAMGMDRRQEDRFYRCEHCGALHLTSQPPRTTQVIDNCRIN